MAGESYDVHQGCRKAFGNVKGFDIIPNSEQLKNIMQEIFTDEYMQKYTNFQNLAGFQYSSAVICNWEKDPLIFSRYLLDNFVRESTQFISWDEMVVHAVEEKYL